MTRVLISSPDPSHDGFPSSSKSSASTSVVAFNPSPEAASVVSDNSNNPDVPVQPLEGTAQPSFGASLESLDYPFSFQVPSPVTLPDTNERGMPVPSVEGVPTPRPASSQDASNGYFTFRSSHSVTPSISLSPPTSSAVPSRSIPTTPKLSPAASSVRATELTGDMAALRLSDAVPSDRGTRPSTPKQATPSTATVDGSPVADSKPSSAGPATPRTVATHRIPTRSSETLSPPSPATPRTAAATSPGSDHGAPTAEPFNLLSIQAALDQATSHQPHNPQPSPNHQRHLSPTPTPTPARRRAGITPSPRRTSSNAAPRHEVADEAPPANRFHQPSFQASFRSARQLMTELAAVLSSAPSDWEDGPDSTVRRRREEAVELGGFACPERRTVGFVGDSGVGKSSLVNALLDVEYLARTSSGGTACTCVVTEFCYWAREGFGVAVEYYEREEVETRVREMVEGYRHRHLAKGLSSDEIKVYEEKAKIAEDTFQAMFPRRMGNIKGVLLGGRGEDQGGEARRGASEDEEEQVVRKIMSWVDEMPRSATENETFEDSGSCSRRLMELTSNPGSVLGTALWPFIRKIRVSCNAHILSKGLVLVDLPGLHDTNSARRNITELYIRHCDEIFAVCNIKRAESNPGVMAVINLAKKAELSNVGVGIICTGSDSIEAEETKKDWELKGLAQEVAALQALRQRVTEAEQESQDLKAAIEEYNKIGLDELLDEESYEYVRLGRRLSRAEDVLAQRRFELKEHLVSTRNRIVRQELRETYLERVPGNDLFIFCVSNTDYFEYRNRPRDISSKFLELSGIIEVRRHCISIVAESQLRTATSYMKQQIPALLDKLQVWVESASGSYTAQEKNAIRHTLEHVERTLRRGLTGANSTLGRPLVKAACRSFLANYRNKDIWARGAENAEDEWSRLYTHNSYAAFCRHFGCYNTAAVGGAHDWNEEAIESMVFTLSPEWSQLCMRIESQSSNATGVLRDLCDEAVDILVSADQLDDDLVDLLTDSIRRQQSLLETKLDASYDEVRRDLAILRTDVLSGIRTSFIGQAMESSYIACSREYGRGSDARRKSIMHRRLHGGDIFTEMEMKLKAHFNIIADELEERQTQATRTHFLAIKESLDMMRGENMLSEAERDPEFRAKVDQEVRRVKDRLGRLVAGL